jgi:hypothetical protein
MRGNIVPFHPKSTFNACHKRVKFNDDAFQRIENMPMLFLSLKRTVTVNLTVNLTVRLV